MRKLLPIGLCLLIVAPKAGHSISCEEAWQTLAKPLGYQAARATGLAAYHSGKAVAYPVVEPIDLLIRSIGHYRKNGRSGLAGKVGANFLKSLGHAQIFTVLWLFGHFTGTMIQEFDDDVAEEEEKIVKTIPLPDGIRVVADGFGDEDIFQRIQMVKSRTKNEPDTIHRIRFSSEDGLLSQLKQLSLKFGPIAQLEIYDHGTAGYTEHLSDGEWLAKEIMEKGTSRLPDVKFDPKGMFASGARVKFISCSLGSGIAGKTFCSNFATALLVPNGGGVTYTARVPISFGTLEVGAAQMHLPQPPRWMTRVQTPMMHAWGTAKVLVMRKEVNTPNRDFPKTDLSVVLNRVATGTHSSAFPDLREYLYVQLPGQVSQLRDAGRAIEKEFESTFMQEYRGAIEIADKANPPDYSHAFIANGTTLYIRVDETKPAAFLEGLMSEVEKKYPKSRVELDRPEADEKYPRYHIKVTAPSESIDRWSAGAMLQIENSILPATRALFEEIKERLEKAKKRIGNDTNLSLAERQLREDELKALGQVMALKVFNANRLLDYLRIK